MLDPCSFLKRDVQKIQPKQPKEESGLFQDVNNTSRPAEQHSHKHLSHRPGGVLEAIPLEDDTEKSLQRSNVILSQCC